jgi:hypothetical protein
MAVVHITAVILVPGIHDLRLVVVSVVGCLSYQRGCTPYKKNNKVRGRNQIITRSEKGARITESQMMNRRKKARTM